MSFDKLLLSWGYNVYPRVNTTPKYFHHPSKFPPVPFQPVPSEIITVLIYRLFLPLLKFHINGIIQQLYSCVWLL